MIDANCDIIVTRQYSSTVADDNLLLDSKVQKPDVLKIEGLAKNDKSSHTNVNEEGARDCSFNGIKSSSEAPLDSSSKRWLAARMPREFIEKASTFRNKMKTSFISNHHLSRNRMDNDYKEDFVDPSVFNPSGRSVGSRGQSLQTAAQVAFNEESNGPSLPNSKNFGSYKDENEETTTYTILLSARDSKQALSQKTAQISRNFITKACSFQSRFKKPFVSSHKERTEPPSDSTKSNELTEEHQIAEDAVPRLQDARSKVKENYLLPGERIDRAKRNGSDDNSSLYNHDNLLLRARKHPSLKLAATAPQMLKAKTILFQNRLKSTLKSKSEGRHRPSNEEHTIIFPSSEQPHPTLNNVWSDVAENGMYDNE